MSKEMLELADAFEEKGSDILFDLSAEQINLIVAALRASAVAETAEAIREILRAHIFASRHYEIRGLDEAANAILALKEAPAK